MKCRETRYIQWRSECLNSARPKKNNNSMSAPKLRERVTRPVLIGNPVDNPKHFRLTVVWSLVGVVVLLAALTTVLLVNLTDNDHHHHHHDDDNDDNDGANLVLRDSQRIALESLSTDPQVGNKDIILIVVENVDDHTVVNITVTVEVTSEARRRTTSTPAVVCPPLYVDNVVPALTPFMSTTCNALYILTSEDVVNGNVIHTHSTATGTIDDTDMSTAAKPGMSKLELTDLPIPHGAILSIPGPTGPAGPVNVKVGPCSTTPPLTSFPCDDASKLDLLVCSLMSNMTLIGNTYLCVNNTWEFLGSFDVFPDNGGGGNSTGPTGPTGPQGIGIYAAQCSGGPPPTTVAEPTYTCDSAFALNMIFCNLGSTNDTSGIIYACVCNPICGWVEVANLNGGVPFTDLHCIGFNVDPTPNVWTDMCHVSLPRLGWYYCLAESNVWQETNLHSCSLIYGLSTVSATPTWMSNSNRYLNLPPNPANTPSDPQWSAPILTTAVIETTTAPEVIYFTSGVGNESAGCGNWRSSYEQPATINCIMVSLLP